MPLLPTDGLFAIDSLFGNNNIGLMKQTGVWQWKDDSGVWRSYNAIDNRIIEVKVFGLLVVERERCDMKSSVPFIIIRMLL